MKKRDGDLSVVYMPNRIGAITYLCAILIHFCSVAQYDDGGDIGHTQGDGCGDKTQLSTTCIQAHHAIKVHSTKKPVTTMLTYPWKCTVLHCNHMGNTGLETTGADDLTLSLSPSLALGQ